MAEANADKLRKRLAEIDQLRKWSREAEFARSSIRCLLTPSVRLKDRVIGFFRTFTTGEFEPLSQEVTDAMYQALAIVRDNYARQANDLERLINEEGTR